MGSNVVRFLERKWVIQTFGLALIVSPYFNILIQFLILNSKSGISWRYISISSYLMSGSITNYILAAASNIIGLLMLKGSAKAWKYVLILVGAHLAMQLLNYNSKEWNTPMSWIAFIVNLAVFLFIADQLVWKIQPAAMPAAQVAPQEKILHLTSYKKIIFSFGSDRPWGRLMTLTSHQLIVNRFGEAPKQLEDKIVQINFTKDLIVDIKFDRQESNLYYFTPMNMNPERIQQLNQWLKKIAV